MLAVRTATAKLVKYAGHPEWTQLFDLSTDPYEKKNLFNDPAAANLRQRMLAALRSAAEAVNFNVPAGADYPFSLASVGLG